MQTFLTTAFICFAKSIDRVVRNLNDELLLKIFTEDKLKQFDEMTKAALRRDKQILKARADSLVNLKVIVWTMWLTTVFNLCYSLCVFFLYAPECYAVRISSTLDSVFTLIDRLDSYIIWFYPIIYLFWPTKSNLVQEKRKDKVIEYSSTASSNRSSINRYQAQIVFHNGSDSTSSSSDDDMYDFKSMGSKSNVFVLNWSKEDHLAPKVVHTGSSSVLLQEDQPEH
jgi:hypothetical protein